MNGLKKAAKLLSLMPQDEAIEVLKNLSLNDKFLAGKLESKMYDIEDIKRLPARDIALLIKNLSGLSLEFAICLKAYGEDVQNYVYSKITKRQAQSIKDDIKLIKLTPENFLKAEEKVLKVFRTLIKQGKVVLDEK